MDPRTSSECRPVVDLLVTGFSCVLFRPSALSCFPLVLLSKGGRCIPLEGMAKAPKRQRFGVVRSTLRDAGSTNAYTSIFCFLENITQKTEVGIRSLNTPPAPSGDYPSPHVDMALDGFHEPGNALLRCLNESVFDRL